MENAAELGTEAQMYRDLFQPNRFAAKAACCLACLLIVSLCPDLAKAYYSGGTGEPDDPFLISTPEDLNTIGLHPEHWDKHFKLTDHVDMSDYSSFNMIGHYGTGPDDPNYRPFTGVLDGGKTIQYLTLVVDDGEAVGLFRVVGEGGMVSRVDLSRGEVAGPDSDYVGALTGANYGTIDNCGGYNCDIIGGDYVGGLAGTNYGTITNCEFEYSGTVVGRACLGGLVGANYGVLEDSYIYSCSVEGTSNIVGGLVGLNSGGDISQCRARWSGSVSGAGSIGGLVGYNIEGTVLNCRSEWAVNAQDTFVGGLIGRNDGGRVESCYASDNVNGLEVVGGLIGGNYFEGAEVWYCRTENNVNGFMQVGGLVGLNSGGSVNASHSLGGVSGTMIVGGLVGHNRTGATKSCYAKATVSGQRQVGGLVGKNEGGLVENCHADGPVEATISRYYSAGGLVADNDEDATIRNCYSTGEVVRPSPGGGLVGDNDGAVVASFWDTDTSGQLLSAGGTGLNTGEMQIETTFTDAGWDFVGEAVNGSDEIWRIWPDNDSYPKLSWDLFGGGEGTAEAPYLIYTPEHLRSLVASDQSERRKHYRLMADIDLSDYSDTGFDTIPGFYGVFDGNGHKIMNLTVRVAGVADSVGLFESLDGTIKNLGLVDPNIEAAEATAVGALVGMIGWPTATISNCYVEGGRVVGDWQVGGIVGGYVVLIPEPSCLSMTDCYSTCSVYGNWMVGGLVGHHSAGGITDCYSGGRVEAEWESGGLVGWAQYHGQILRCYSTASVQVEEDTGGGLVGWNGAEIFACYATGDVTATREAGGLIGTNAGAVGKSYAVGPVTGEEDTGGLIGTYAWGTPSAYDCFWDSNTSGQLTSAGGIEKTTSEMQTKSTFTSAGWDFLTTWAICEGTNYPRFIRQIPAGDVICPDGVNGLDFAVLAWYWHETNCAGLDDCGGVDVDFSGGIDFTDLRALAQYWLSGF